MSSTESSPLKNQRILVTRSRHQQSSLYDPLHALGATVIAVPLIELKSVEDSSYADIYANLRRYDWIVFTSVNAIEYFVEALSRSAQDLNAIGHCKIACVGPITAKKLSDYKLTADLVPDTYVAEGLMASFSGISMTGQNVLLPRAETARDVLPNALAARGAHVQVVPIYRTTHASVSEKHAAQLNARDLDAVTFTSSSTVRALEKWIDGKEQARFKTSVLVFCIGPMTSATAIEHGYRRVVTAETYTIAGLIKSLTVHLSELTERETTI